MRLNRIVTIVVIFLGLTANALAMKTTIQGKVMQVKDGDTVTVSPCFALQITAS